MKRLVPLALALALGLPPATALAEDSAPDTLTSVIRKVTVYSDRARVTRAADVTLGSNPRVYVFEKLPGWVDDGSVRVSLAPPAAGRIVDVRVKREYLARASDKAYLDAEEEVKGLQAELGALDDELKVLAAQAKQIEGIRMFSLEKISKDSALRDVSVESYGKVVAFISDQLRATAKARRTVLKKRVDLTPELQAKQRKLAELKGLTQLEQTSVFVTVSGAPGTSGSVELTYMLPGATWEPTHELRVSRTRPGTAEVTSYAVVTQTSGENWENAEIAFATQSSTEAVRIPQLEALTLGDTKSATRIMKSRVSSFTRAQRAFGAQNRMWNKFQQQKSSQHNFEKVYESNFNYLQVVQSKTVQIFAGLQRRGTSAHFKGQGRATVRGDGHSVRVQIGHSKPKATQRIVAAPEQSLNAALTLRMTNSAPQPLLPGKVAIYRDGAFLGMTDLDFIAEGEIFSMFLSVADQLKLSRRLDKKHSSIVRKKRTRMQVAFVVTVENLASTETQLNLADRIPVSQNKEIKIDRVTISPGVKPDTKGLVRWDLTLQPKEKRTFRIAYRIEYPPTLILRTKQELHRRSKRRAHPSQAAPAGDAPQLEEQIMNLEDNF